MLANPAATAPTYFRAVTDFRSNNPAARVQSVATLLGLAEGPPGPIQARAASLLVDEFGPNVLEFAGPGGGCAAPIHIIRGCEAAGLECGTCPWGWKTPIN
jgi:hypothetical protein